MTLKEVKFSQLVAPEQINARPATKEGIDELAASIAARGLIQPLAVRPADSQADRFEVIDGRRRFLAMQQLVRARQMSKSDAVAVVVRNEDDAEALETSLVANTVRLPMHPVDQHEVFARLEAQGRAPAEIAERFGLAERTVRQRLALAALAPAVRKAWREGKIGEKIAQAFTVSASHEAQEAVWSRHKKNPTYLSEYTVKSELTGDRPSAKSLPAALLAAYEAAGGRIAESLFDDDRVIESPDILKLVKARALDALREKLKAEGWAWVSLVSEIGRSAIYSWDNVLGGAEDDDPPLTAEEAAQVEAFEDAGEWDQAEAIKRAAHARRFTPEMKARSGVVIDDLDGSDDHEIYRGLLKPSDQADIEDPPRRAAMGDDENDGIGDDGDPDEMAGAGGDEGAPAISNALMQSLTEAQTLAVASVLPDFPRIALAAAIASLRTRRNKPLVLRAVGHKPITADGDFDTELAKCLGETDLDLADAFAHLMAHAVQLLSFNANSDRTPAEALVAALPAESYLDAMRSHFLPEDYFKRVTKDLCLEALDEMAEAGHVPAAQVEALADAKKLDIARIAADTAAACGWLPPLLRHPGTTSTQRISAAA